VGPIWRLEKQEDGMVGKRLGFAWLCLLCALSACFHTGARVDEPTPLVATGKLETTEQVILDTLPKHNWTAETVEPGRVVAFLAVRTHLLRVEIRYTATEATVKYVDSDNLDEKRDGDVIYVHKNAVRWMRTLQKDLSAALAASTTYGAAPASSGT
jgi:hypothetical protein